MMFRAGFLLCMITIGGLFVNGGTTLAPTPPARLEFTCDDNDGTISIKSVGLNEYHSIYAIGTLANNDTEHLCSVTNEVPNTETKFIIKECKPDKPVTVYIIKHQTNHGNTNVLPPTFLIGGEGTAAYMLECYKESPAEDLPNAFQVARKFEFSLQPTLAPKVKEGSVYINMSILTAEGAPVNAQSVVLIGTKLIILIKGPAGPSYHVKECRAYSTNDMKNTNTTLLSDNNVDYTELMTAFALPTTTSSEYVRHNCSGKFCIESFLYAFRFKSDNSVTLECTIDVCNGTSTTNCAGSGFTASPVIGKRRRRESDSQLHVLRSTIVVQDRSGDNLETASSGNLQRSPFHLIATLAALWVFRRVA